MKHIPVLLEEVVNNLQTLSLRDGFFMDGTFGRGGHTDAILNARPDIRVIGLDCDEDAIQYGFAHFSSYVESGRLTLYKGHFDVFDEILVNKNETPLLLGILLDLGVSSPQLDEGPRGFSFYHDGPLDMRMDRSIDFTAQDIVNTWPEDDLNNLFKSLGEVRNPFRVSEKIVQLRREKKFTTTGELSQLIERVEGWRKKGHHPATNYFMALRLEVNQELVRVASALPKMVDALLPGGRLLVITFHSLEDRIVKQLMKDWVKKGWGQLVNKKVLQASWNDKKKNPRARSAKLRVFEKTKH